MITIIITAVYSRDLRYKETMIELMMNLPDDMFRLELLPYLTVDDIVKLDSACVNHKYRPQLLDKISGLILLGDKDESLKVSLFEWLGIRRIYLINMNLDFEDDSYFSCTIENDYVDQFRYTQHVVMRGHIRGDDMVKFIISHCLYLLSIDISEFHDDESSSILTDHTLQSIAEHCTGLQSLSLSDCWELTEAGLVAISEHCTNLKSLKIGDCCEITDVSIISISNHCTGLQTLNLWDCREITDVSIISVSTHCTGLQSLDLWGCREITDASIISISTQCLGLQSLNLQGCRKITDASIIPISENCTGLKRLFASETNITDASLIAIAKNCTGLQLLRTYGCNGLSSDKLRYEFESVSELRAVLLSIYSFISAGV